MQLQAELRHLEGVQVCLRGSGAAVHSLVFDNGEAANICISPIENHAVGEALAPVADILIL
jgi:hypothetical protein